MRSAWENLEAAVKELQSRVDASILDASIASEIENGLIEVTTKISELERKLENCGPGSKGTAPTNG